VWRPSPVHKHALPLLGEPTRGDAERARWFQPLRVGALELETRTWVPAMVPWRASPDGLVTPRVLAWYERFARGRPGAIVVEATGIRDVPSGPLLRIGDDRFLAGLRQLVDVVKQASGGRTRLFIQLIDFLSIKRRPAREKYLGQFLTITREHQLRTGTSSEAEARAALLALDDAALRAVLTTREWEALMFGQRERVTDSELAHVRELPQLLPGLFAAAAGRAAEAGFDGVELHYAHAYTMASFLSALNTRQDGHGTTLEGRARLPLEVLAAVRARASRDFAVGVRFLAEECIEGGSTLADACFFAERFARAGADFLSLSRGGKFEDAKQPKVGHAAYPYTGKSGWECMPTVHADARGPFGRNLEAARAIRARIRAAGFDTPVVLAGGIASFTQAEEALANGAADIVAAARQSLADPDWFTKLREGRGNEVRRCTFTNYCEGLDQMHEPVTCKLWDRVDVDQAPDVHDGRRLTAPLSTCSSS
jgi:2,4-dienoyl-CoA reductase-like NADH-dependent reductase (Old Yellow Enzyme family)